MKRGAPALSGWEYFVYMFRSNPYLFLILPVIVITFIAQIRVKSVYNKYAAVPTRTGISSVDAAQRILTNNGLYDIRIAASGGALSDHYDPKNKVIALSADQRVMTSVAAVAVAAHECGHALQHAKGYTPLMIRNKIAPVVGFASRLAFPLLIIGMLVGYMQIAYAAAIIFGAVLLFQLVTLPVELNASRRALAALTDCCILTEEETSGAKKVLNAAALTYLAATLMAFVQFLRFFMMARRRR